VCIFICRTSLTPCTTSSWEKKKSSSTYQDNVGFCNQITFLILYCISFRLVPLLNVSNVQLHLW
jgi:hypothetical protein